MKTTDKPVPFGYKCAWYAVSSASPAYVVEAIDLAKPKRCRWQQGIYRRFNSDGGVYVTPPLGNWICLVGGMLMPSYQVTASKDVVSKLIRLSKVFGTAVFFSTYRVTEYHIYAKAEEGKLIRGYGYIGERGETFWNEGIPTKEEEELSFRFFDPTSPAAASPGYWERKDFGFLNESKIMLIAGRWSVDPSKLDEWTGPTTRWVGRYGECKWLCRRTYPGG